MSTFIKNLFAIVVCSASTFAPCATPSSGMGAAATPTTAATAFGVEFPFISVNGNSRIDFQWLQAPFGQRIVVDMISMSATLPSNNEVYVPCLAKLSSGDYTTTTTFPIFGGTRIQELGSVPVKIYADALVCGILRSDSFNTVTGKLTVVGHYEPAQ